MERGQLIDRDPVGRVAHRAPGFDCMAPGRGTGGACFGSATILLYLAVAFAVQRMVVIARLQRLPISGQNQVTSLA